MIAFVNLRGKVKDFGSHAHLLEPIGVTVGEWVGYDDDTKKMKLQFAEQAAKVRAKGGA